MKEEIKYLISGILFGGVICFFIGIYIGILI